MILIVDDDSSILTSLSLLFKQGGFKTRTAKNPSEAIQILNSETVDLVLQDMNFSRNSTGEEGISLLKEIKKSHENIPVILMTAWGSISLAVEGMKLGASDFITKPWTNEQILQSVKTTLSLAAVNSTDSEKNSLSREELDSKFNFKNIIGSDPKLVKLLNVISRISKTDASVLITGESGTGKELVAEAIHQNSLRKHKPFVKINMGGIPTGLFESEMFGHVKGSFTDAVADRKGRFETANEGTIFLDEIGEVDLNSQVKLLRVLQERTYEVLGSSHSKHLDIRIISATNQNLSEAVKTGDFREDLFYRLNLIPVHLPSLRERKEDIPVLAKHFIKQIGHQYQKSDLLLSKLAEEWLKKQPFPGNIRELRHLIERTVLMISHREILVQDFSAVQELHSSTNQKNELPDVGSMTLDEIEKAMILKSIQHHNGNISKVADSLGISRAALYRRLEKFGISV